MDTFEIVTEYCEEVVQACYIVSFLNTPLKKFSLFFLLFKHLFSVYIAVLLKGRAVFKS